MDLRRAYAGGVVEDPTIISLYVGPSLQLLLGLFFFLSQLCYRSSCLISRDAVEHLAFLRPAAAAVSRAIP
jgi:hypothetical protein